MNIGVLIFFGISILGSFGYIPRSGIAVYPSKLLTVPLILTFAGFCFGPGPAAANVSPWVFPEQNPKCKQNKGC